MKRILITGASGMLGATMALAWQDKYDIYATGRSNFQNNPSKKFLTFDFLHQDIEQLIEWAQPDVVIHCAAITDIDFCQSNPSLARAINSQSVRNLACSRESFRLIYISTDAVFSNHVSNATESDESVAVNEYGQSKALGERYCELNNREHVIIRTTPVGFNINPGKVGFVQWLLSSVKAKKPINLFYDVVFTPIDLWHLISAIEWVVENNFQGKVHIAGGEVISKYEFGIGLIDAVKEDVAMITRGSIENKAGLAFRRKDQTLSSDYFCKISGFRAPTMFDIIESLIENISIYNDRN